MAKGIFEDSVEKYPAKKRSRVREGKKSITKSPRKETEDAPLEPVLVSVGDLKMVKNNQRQAEARKRGEGNGETVKASVSTVPEAVSTIVDVAPLEVASQAINTSDAEKIVEDAKTKEEEWRVKYNPLIDQRLYSGDNWIQIRDHNFSTREFKIFSNLEAWHKKIISQEDLDKLLEEYKLSLKKDSKRRFVKETKMNVEEALRDIQLKKEERLRAIAKGGLEKEWAENAHEMFVIIPPHVLKSFDLMSEGDKNKVIEALDVANKEIEIAWNLWKKGQKIEKKEITAEDLEVFLEVANEHRKRLRAEYEKEGLLEGYSERRKRDLLDVKTAKFLGDRFQENFEVSQKKAEELADKIMEKVEA